MRTLLVSMLLIGVVAAAVIGIVMPNQTPEKKPATFAELRDDYHNALKKGQETPAFKKAEADVVAANNAMKEATDPVQANALRERLIKARVHLAKLEDEVARPINREYSLKFLHFGESHKDDATGLDSLAFALHTCGGPFDKSGTWNAALKNIGASHLNRPEIRKLLPTLAEIDDDAAHGVMREIIAKHPDRKVQAKACKTLAMGLMSAAETGEALKKKEFEPEQLEKQTSKAYVARLMARTESNAKEAEALMKTVAEKYGDVMPDLSVGKAAPEISTQNIEGKAAKLSDLKGKVVVLDFWATWCKPCRDMIPHEREMVAKLKGKPFTLVSISADEDKKELNEFLEKEKMPWTHWWSGDGGVVEDWDIEQFPTIFVLDDKGVIRFKEIRGKELEEAVEKLLKEMETPAGK